MREKNVLIAPIGLNPAVVTEVLYSISGVERITDVSMIATSDKQVQACAKLVKVAVEEESRNLFGRKVYVHIHTMNVEDVNTTEKAVKFIQTLTHIMKAEFNIHQPRKIFFDIAGSRKVESAIMLMVGMIWRVHGVYHVIHKDVRGYNLEVEMIRSDIDRILDVDNPIEYYKENREKFYPILFPNPQDYNVFEIPFIPFSKQEINALKEILRGMDISDSPYGDYELRLYRKMGLITVSGERIIPTDLGKIFLEVLEVI